MAQNPEQAAGNGGEMQLLAGDNIKRTIAVERKRVYMVAVAVFEDTVSKRCTASAKNLSGPCLEFWWENIAAASIP